MKERQIIFSGPMVRAILDGRKSQTRRVVKLGRIGGIAYDDICPFGVAGDRLWVRETWRPTGVCAGKWTSVLYRADETHIDRPYFATSLATSGWHPAIHMPRRACRLELEVTRVRVERLQEITEDDAKAEGSEPWDSSPMRYRVGYERLWDSLNAKRGYGWATNPWVWVIEFKRMTI